MPVMLPSPTSTPNGWIRSGQNRLSPITQLLRGRADLRHNLQGVPGAPRWPSMPAGPVMTPCCTPVTQRCPET